MQILKQTGLDWHKRLISKLYMGQNVKIWLDQGEARSVEIRKRVTQGCCSLPILL